MGGSHRTTTNVNGNNLVNIGTSNVRHRSRKFMYSPFHGGNTGSIPVGRANSSSPEWIYFLPLSRPQWTFAWVMVKLFGPPGPDRPVGK